MLNINLLSNYILTMILVAENTAMNKTGVKSMVAEFIENEFHITVHTCKHTHKVKRNGQYQEIGASNM